MQLLLSSFAKKVLFKSIILAILVITVAALQSRATAPVGVVEAQVAQPTSIIPDGMNFLVFSRRIPKTTSNAASRTSTM